MKFAFLIACILGAVAGKTASAQLRVTMISLGVADLDRSVRFYRDTLGLELAGKPSEVAMIRAGEITIVLNLPAGRNSQKPLAENVEVIFPVESVAAAHADLAKRGCRFAVDPHEVTPGMWAATFSDPDGHQLTILGGR